MPDRCFCEAIRPQLIKQPANTISGLAFVGVAILVLLSSLRAATSRAVYPILYGAAALLIGAGTIFYHASLTFWGQTADVLGMYLVATFLVLYNAARLRTIAPAAASTAYIVGNVALLAGLIFMPEARRYVFAALLVLALGLELAARRKEKVATGTRLFKAAMAVLALGFVIWTLDITRVVCSPDSWLQGHALWHIAGAVAVWLVFVHYDLLRLEQGE